MFRKIWKYFWNFIFTICSCLQNLRSINTLELSVLISFVICGLNLSNLLLWFLLLEKFWNNYSMFRTMCRLLCKNLSFRTIEVWSVEIYLLLNMVCFEYFSCIHALLFLSKIFTASCWLDVLPGIHFVAAETVPSLWIEIVK